jgi:integrase
MPTKNLYRRGQTYYGRFHENGGLRRVCLHTTDLREAKARLKGLKLQAERKAFGVEDAPIWEQAVLAYTTGVLNSGTVKPATAKRYLVSLGQLGPYFEGRSLPDINTKMIGDYVASRQAASASNATIRRDLTTLSRVLSYASSRGMVAANVADDYDRTQVRERRVAIRAPSDAAIEAAARAVEPVMPQMAALLRFLRANGLRSGEALRAVWEDVAGGVLTIHETKSGRVRAIDVSALPSGGPGGRLFPDLPEDSLTLAGRWSWLRRKCPGLPRFRLHDLRHAYAIAEIVRGRDIYDLSRHLGHTSVKTTEVYLAYRPARSFSPGDTGGDTSPRQVTQETVGRRQLTR